MDFSFDIIAGQLGMDSRYFAEFFALLKIRRLHKSEIILREGDTCNFIGIVISGALRTYYINDSGEDVSFLFHFNNRLEDFIFTDYESVLLSNRSKLNIQATEDSIVYILSKDDWGRLILKDAYWQKFVQSMTEKVYLSAKRRVEDLLYYSPEKRYLNLLAVNPKVFQNFAQKFIASYLGIKPQSLSRIRNRLALN